MSEIINYEDFAAKLKSAITLNYNLRVEFIFADESSIKPDGQIKKIKSKDH